MTATEDRVRNDGDAHEDVERDGIQPVALHPKIVLFDSCDFDDFEPYVNSC